MTARLDRKAAWALVPRLLWLGYASYVSLGTALRSRDEFVGWDPKPEGQNADPSPLAANGQEEESGEPEESVGARAA